MKQTRREHLMMLGAGVAAAATPTVAMAEGTVHEVQMLNKHPDDKKKKNVFMPDIVRAMPGDTIRFVSVDKGHNSVSDKNMMPEGAEGWESKLSKDFEVTLTVEGTYGYYCTPHRSLGMVGLILVGDPSSNYEACKAAKQKGKAKKVYKDIFERADAMLAAEG